MESNSKNLNSNKTDDLKKTYHPPELLVYGNIREITRNLGPKGNLDNGGGNAAGPKTGT